MIAHSTPNATFKKKCQATRPPNFRSKEKHENKIDAAINKITQFSATPTAQEVIQLNDFMSKYKDELSLRQLETFLIILVKKFKFTKKIIAKINMEKDLYLAIQNTLGNETYEKYKDAIFIEIYWQFVNLGYQMYDFWKDPAKKDYCKIRDLFTYILKKNHPLKHLHLAYELEISAYDLRKTNFMPIPVLMNEFNLHGHVDKVKTLKSFGLLGFDKSDIPEEFHKSFLQMIIKLLNEATQQQKADTLNTLMWAIARFNFDFDEISQIKCPDKDILLLDHFAKHLENCPRALKDPNIIGICLWSLALIGVPKTHKLYSLCYDKISLFEESKKVTSMTARLILSAQIIYQFDLTKDCKDKLVDKIQSEKTIIISSAFHISIEKVLKKLLAKERDLDQALPSSIIREYELKGPGIAEGLITIDGLFEPGFGFECDGPCHEANRARDKLKNLMLEKLNVTIVRIQQKDTERLSNRELEIYLKKEVIDPFIKHHQAKKSLEIKNDAKQSSTSKIIQSTNPLPAKASKPAKIIPGKIEVTYEATQTYGVKNSALFYNRSKQPKYTTNSHTTDVRYKR